MQEDPDDALAPTFLGSEEAADDESQKRIGPYLLRRSIGEGGMGEVYEAEQHEPIRRSVALKLIKGAMVNRETIARFESERQALALMDHPNIAHVYDAGTTEDGRPYFAMEFVKGTPITQYCDGKRLTTRERLELFVRVCSGVQHAHQKGIIHRDIKPSNVLVTQRDDEAVPKIIDFGIAKATVQQLSEGSAVTQYGQLIGTLEYMSPEQAEMSGLDIDTRADVYALGALLYELMTGKLPFDPAEIRKSGFGEFRRMLIEDDPPAPSTRIDTHDEGSTKIAASRGTKPETLARQLQGEIDWIITKALEKDRTRRYASASELAADITRFLTNEPVLAGRPSGTYRIKKFVQRHRMAVSFAAALVVLLAGVAVTMTILASQIARERDRANQEAETARHVSEFLVGLFEVSDPVQALGNTITAREILDRGAARIVDAMRDQPEIQARLLTTMGRVYTELGLYDEAKPLLRMAPEILGSAVAIDETEVATSLLHLAILLRETGSYDEARPLFERSLAIRREQLGDDHPDVATSLNEFALLYWQTADYARALELFEQALAIRESRLGPEHPDSAEVLNSLAMLADETGDDDEARSLYDRTLRIQDKALASDDPRVAATLNNLANLHVRAEEYGAAKPLYERALSITEKVKGPEHPDVAMNLSNLAVLLKRTGNLEQARSLYERARLINERALGPDHIYVALDLNNLASLLAEMGDFERAEPMAERAIEICENSVGTEHPYVAGMLDTLANLLWKKGEIARARTVFERVLAIQQAVYDPEHPELETTRRNLADVGADLEGEAKQAPAADG